MKINRGYKYRCYPNAHQEGVLNGMMAARRVFWNLILDMYNEKVEHNKKAEKDEDKIAYRLVTDKKGQKPNTEVYGKEKVIAYGNSKSEGKKDYSWLSKCHSTIYPSVVCDLHEAWEKFYNFTKNGGKGIEVGAPSHKKVKDVSSVTVANTGVMRSIDGHILWDGNKVIPVGYRQIGILKCKLHRRFEGVIKHTTFSKDIDGKWYISFGVEQEVEDVNPPTNVDPSDVIGIDAGLKTALVTANATDGDDSYKNINYSVFRQELKRLKKKRSRIQRAMARCVVTMTREGAEPKIMTVKEMDKRRQENKDTFSGYHKNYSNGYLRLLERERKLEAHIRRKREDKNHNITYKIAEQPVQLIVTEDLHIKEMMERNKTKKKRGIEVKAEGDSRQKPRKKMAEHFSDIGHAQISTMLEYKALQRGKAFIKVDRYFASSKICSHCGYKNTKLKLSDRKWVCPNCGAELNRDGNAAKNIAKKGLEEYNKTKSA